MAETPATRTSLQRTPPPSLPYKLEIDQLKRRLALVAGGTYGFLTRVAPYLSHG